MLLWLNHSGWQIRTGDSTYRLTDVDSMSAQANPYHNAQAESFMKTLKVKEAYLAGYEA